MTTDCTYDIKHDVFFSQYTFTLTQQAKNRTDVHTSHINHPSINSFQIMDDPINEVKHHHDDHKKKIITITS